MRKLLFATSTGCLGDITPMLEIAKACKQQFQPVFKCYGGTFSYLVEEAGYEAHYLPIVRHKNYLVNPDWLYKKVVAEIKLWERIGPTAILNKHEITPVLSARAAGIPLVWILHFPWSRPCFDRGILTGSPLSLIDVELPSRLTMEEFLRPYQIVAKRLGLAAIHDFYDLFEGEHTLITDIPTITQILDLPPNYHYIGSLQAYLDLPIPTEISCQLPTDRKIIYFAMGSSGDPQLIKRLIQSFAQRPEYYVIAPVAHHINHLDIEVPENVLVTGWLPAHIVNPMADISLIHGGQGTVNTACLSATPIVGIGMYKEQEINLEMLVRQGCARRLDKSTVTEKDVLTAIDDLVADPTVYEQAKRVKEIYVAWQGPQIVASYLWEQFGK